MKENNTGFNPTIIAQRLAEERAKRNMTLSDMEKLLNISFSTVSSYEKGRIVPSIDKLYQIAEVFGVSIDYLCGRDEYKSESMESLADIARLVLRLCDFEGVCLDDTRAREIVLRFFDKDMQMYLRTYFYTQLEDEYRINKYQKVEGQERDRLCELLRLGLSSKKISRKSKDTDVQALYGDIPQI